MKMQLSQRANQADGRLPASHGRRGGAVIIIVLSLMAALAFLGFFFYEFTVFERSAAERFASVEVDYDPTAHFDDALEQVIVGTRNTHLDSVLWGNKYSLLATQIGRLDRDSLQPLDLNPHSGSGVRVRFSDVDNGDGRPDDSMTSPDGVPNMIEFRYLDPSTGNDVYARFFDSDFTPPAPPGGVVVTSPRFNLSRVADGTVGIATGPPAVNQVPDYRPDVGYTYPDINSMFLSYDSTVTLPTGAGPPAAVSTRIQIPSFVRHQYFYDRRAGVVDDFTQLYRDSTTAGNFSGDSRGLVFRPHEEHRRFDSTGADVGQRYISPVTPAALQAARSGGLSGADRTLTPLGFLTTNSQGVFSTGGVAPEFDLDIDCDGDGVNDGILMDLDLPIVDFDDGRQGIPLVSFKIVDTDGLINLNAHGNQLNLERISRIIGKASYPEFDPPLLPTPPGATTSTNPARNRALDVWASDRKDRYFGAATAGTPPQMISSSAFGLSPYEVNPAFALSAWSPFYYQGRTNPWSTPTSPFPTGFEWVSLAQLPHGHIFGDISVIPANTTRGLSAGLSANLQTELAQMEWFMLMNGHSGEHGFHAIDGRHGESSLAANGTVGNSRRLQPVVTRDSSNAGINSFVPGAGQSFTNDANSDDDRDQVGIETWVDSNSDGNAQDSERDLDGNGTFDQQNAIATGGSYRPEKLGGYLAMPPSVHPTASLVVADPFGVDAGSGRDLELAEARVGLRDNTAARWPNYADVDSRNWYMRNYVAMQLLNFAPLGVTPTAPFVVDATSTYFRVAGVAPFAAGAMGLTSHTTNFAADFFDLVNEENEQIIGEAHSLSQEVDSLFDVFETAALHLSDTDYDASGLMSRLRALAPLNFDLDPEAAEIRKRFTTESNDRLELHIAPSAQRPWEFSPWLFVAGQVPTSLAPWVGPSGIVAGDIVPAAFPPSFTSGTNEVFTANDPYREVLRVALATSHAGSLSGSGNPNPFARSNLRSASGGIRLAARKPLRLDRVIERIDPSTGEPVYRELVPHPDLASAPFSTLITGPAPLTPVTVSHDARADVVYFDPASITFLERPGTTHDNTNARLAASLQETWAQQDRQNLARDIYVLLYTTCGPSTWNPLTTPVGTPVAENHVSLCAQFAVNVVDAIDRDNVITEFSYDPDLSDGWDTTAANDAGGAAGIDDGSEGTSRISVYGVEAVSLSVSEVLLARTQQLANPESNTSWDDTTSQQFGLIELRNTSPFDVDLDSNSWRMEVIYDAPGGLPAPFTAKTVLDFQRNSGGNFNTVPAGANFLIGDTSDTSISDSNSGFITAAVVDFTAGGSPADNVLPAAPNTSGVPTAPLVDLDLASALNTHAGNGTTTGMVRLSTPQIVPAPSGTPPVTRIVGVPRDDGMANDVNDPGNINYTVRLYRRPNLMDPDDRFEQNRWVLVDEFAHLSRAERNGQNDEVFNPFGVFEADINNDPGGGAFTVDDLATSWFSLERSEPFGVFAGSSGFTNDSEVLGSQDQTKSYSTATTASVDDVRNHTFETDDTAGTGKKHWGNSNTIEDPTASPLVEIGLNPALSGEFRNWQPHFDRDLLSPAELLSTPLFGSVVRLESDVDSAPVSGQYEFTGQAGTVNDAPDQADGAEDTAVRQLINFSATEPLIGYRRHDPASVRPAPNLLGALIGEPAGSDFENYWHRIFDFVHVPADINGPLKSLDDILGTDRCQTRTPGKINLNTIRHEQVLAGLIDEPAHFNPFDGLGAYAHPIDLASRSDDQIDSGARNWWREFLYARDGVDQFTGLPIPGVPGANPFSPATVTLDLPATEAVAQSVVRSGARHVVDNVGAAQDRSTTTGDPDEQGLFEARSVADIGTDEIDPWTRNRLLAKVMNNGSKRSNVFLVWVAIQMHDADHGWQASGAPDLEDVRIGGAMSGFPVYRTLCVVDRSLLEQAYVDPDPTDGQPGTFDFRKFIIHRQRLR